ncbi:MAG: hypothetical protein K8I00_02790, partial [Candidatus Omnitrophica bacterium]|nr:hypothetical protein [Candidatus Omnitrophota bacterium]
MNKPIRDFCGKSKALFWSLLLLLATEVFVTMNVHKLRPPSLSALIYKQYLMEEGRGTSYDMIIMGDSRFMGLNAKYISRELSREFGREYTVYNFALLNQGIRTYTLLLRKYLRNHMPPEYILFGSAPLGITGEWAADKEQGRNQALHYLGQLYSIPELFQALPPRSWGTVLAIKGERLSNLVLYRQAIQKAIDRPNYFYKDYLTPAVRYLDKNNGGLIIG